MENEKKSIFRQSTIERMSTPEQLDQYLQVTKPSTWVLLGAVIAILAGFLTWGCLGKLTTTIHVAVYVQGEECVCFIPEKAYDSLKEKEIKIGNETYKLVHTGYAKTYTDNLPDSIKLAGELADGSVVQPLVVDGTLAEGVYTGEMVVDRISPISFILN